MLKKITIIGVGIFMVLLISASFLLPLLTPRLIDRALVKTLTNDLMEELPDGLHVLLCGAGGPMYDPERSGPCTAVIAGSKIFVFDVGESSGKNLAPTGLSVGDVDQVFLTHFHSDHINGLGSFSMMRWVTGNNAVPLTVYGPKGVQTVVDGFNMAFALDSVYRAAHHGETIAPTSGSKMKAQEFTLNPDQSMALVYEEDDTRIFAFRVNHFPIVPAVGYLIKYKDRSVVISGDTVKMDSVKNAATGADLLIHEVIDPKIVNKMINATDQLGMPKTKKILTDILDYHSTPIQVAQIAQEANVKHLVFSHVVPATPGNLIKSYYLKGVERHFAGNITLGVDYDMFILPADSRKITYKNIKP